MSSTKNNQKSVNEQNSIKKEEIARKKAAVRAATTSNRRRKKLAGRWHNVAMLLNMYDLAVVNFSYISALWLRYDLKFSTIDPSYKKAWAGFTPIYTIFCLFVFWRSRLYKSIWKYASYTELLYVIVATLITASFHILFITAFFRRMPFLLHNGTDSANSANDNDPVLISLCPSAPQRAGLCELPSRISSVTL